MARHLVPPSVMSKDKPRERKLAMLMVDLSVQQSDSQTVKRMAIWKVPQSGTQWESSLDPKEDLSGDLKVAAKLVNYSEDSSAAL